MDSTHVGHRVSEHEINVFLELIHRVVSSIIDLFLNLLETDGLSDKEVVIGVITFLNR